MNGAQGGLEMTNAEQELIDLIRQSSDPAAALKKAVEVITSVLAQLESSQEPSPAALQGRA